MLRPLTAALGPGCAEKALYQHHAQNVVGIRMAELNLF